MPPLSPIWIGGQLEKLRWLDPRGKTPLPFLLQPVVNQRRTFLYFPCLRSPFTDTKLSLSPIEGTGVWEPSWTLFVCAEVGSLSIMYPVEFLFFLVFHLPEVAVHYGSFLLVL